MPKNNNSIYAGYILGVTLVALTVILSRSLYEEYILTGILAFLQAVLGLLALYGNRKCPTKNDELFQVWKEMLPDSNMKKKRDRRILLFLLITTVDLNVMSYLLFNGLFLQSSGDWKYGLDVMGVVLMIIVKKEYAKGPTLKFIKEIYKEIETVLRSDTRPFDRFRNIHPNFNPDTLFTGELCNSDQDYFAIGMLHDEMVKKHTISGIPGFERDDRLMASWKSTIKEYREISKAHNEEEKKVALNKATISTILFGRLLSESFQRLGDYAIWIQEGVERHNMNVIQDSI